jgi:excinuclease ABC subunit A
LTKKDVMLIIDRIVVKAEEEFHNQDAVQTAFYEGKGICHLQELKLIRNFLIRIILN